MGRGRDTVPDSEAGRIEVKCLSCGRTGRFERDDGRLGDEPLVALTKRFRCSQCGSRAVRANAVGTPRDLAARLGERLRPPRG